MQQFNVYVGKMNVARKQFDQMNKREENTQILHKSLCNKNRTIVGKKIFKKYYLNKSHSATSIRL